MKTVQEGDSIEIICEGRLPDGKIFYKYEKENPLKLVVGEGKIFPALERELTNMEVGESKTVTLQPQDAFGNPNQNLVLVSSKKNVDSEVHTEIGSRVGVDLPSGKRLHGTIVGITDETITVDFNHPLAGKTVIFMMTVVSIEEK
jgi:FKBP-type peptidyl-prolyl cis-trans isomerase 2